MIGEVAISTSGAESLPVTATPSPAPGVESGAGLDGSFAERVLSPGPTESNPGARSWWVDPNGKLEKLRAEYGTKFSECDAAEAGLHRAGIPRTDSRYETICRKRGEALLSLQLEVHAAAMQIEIFGKFVEHTTGAIRTATQLQI